MHEFSMATQIVNSILSEVKKHNAKRVYEVHLTIGKLTFLSLEQVKFAYSLLVKNKLLDGSTFHLEEKDGLVKCTNCEYVGGLKYRDDPLFHVPSPTLNCPHCDGVVGIVEGKKCTIKSIKVAT